MTCNGHTAQHDGLEPALYFFNGRTGRQTTVLCRGCSTVIESMGSGWTRDRREDPARPDRGRSLDAIREAYERLPATLDGLPAETRMRLRPPLRCPLVSAGRPRATGFESPTPNGRPIYAGSDVTSRTTPASVGGG